MSIRTRPPSREYDANYAATFDCTKCGAKAGAVATPTAEPCLHCGRPSGLDVYNRLRRELRALQAGPHRGEDEEALLDHMDAVWYGLDAETEERATRPLVDVMQ